MAGGTRFQSKRLEDNRYELVLTAGSDKDVQEIYALYPKKETKSQYLTLGKLNVVTYQKQVNELVLVQVNATINSYEVENKLKEVYAPVGVEWNVKTDEFDYKGDLSNFIDKPSGAFSAYNQKMKDLINAYKADKQVNSKACYVFILKENGVSAENKDSRDAQGIMPRGEQFGFVFTHKGTRALPTEELNQMVAHELGHGRWRLQHVFDSTYGFKDSDKGKTDNLMDYYSNGTDLAKWQWEQLKDPAWFSNPFERDERGMIKTESALKEYLLRNNITEFYYRIPCTMDVTLQLSTWLHGKIHNNELIISPINESPSEITKDWENAILVYKTPKGWEASFESSYLFSGGKSCREYKIDDEDVKRILNDFYERKREFGLSDRDYSRLLYNLKAIKKDSRNNQGYELEHWDKNANNGKGGFRSFTLDQNNNLTEVTSLTDDQINNGNWSDDNIDTRIRYTVNKDGIIQVKAFGFRQSLQLAAGKDADLPKLAEHMKGQTNKFLLENKVDNFENKAPLFKDDGETFADGKKIEIGGKNTGYIKIISEGVGLVSTLAKTARIEQDVYLDKPAGESIIHGPGVVTGPVEAVVKTATDITEPLIMVYDVVVDKKTRTEVYTGLVQIKNEVKEDPSKLFPILWDIVVEEATGNTPDEWGEMNNDHTDDGRKGHLVSKGAVRTALTVVLSGKLVTKLPKMADDVAKKMSNVTKKIDEISTLLLNSGDDFTNLSKARKLPGKASGTGKEITGKWLRGTDGNAGLFPKSVADKLRGRTFKDFDEFRQAFWKEVANDPHLAKQFDAQSLQRMKGGLAPYTNMSQQIGGQKNYILHHRTPINQGGGVYDVDNLYIVTPKYHKEILDPAYHYGYGY